MLNNEEIEHDKLKEEIINLKVENVILKYDHLKSNCMINTRQCNECISLKMKYLNKNLNV